MLWRLRLPARGLRARLYVPGQRIAPCWWCTCRANVHLVGPDELQDQAHWCNLSSGQLLLLCRATPAAPPVPAPAAPALCWRAAAAPEAEE